MVKFTESFVIKFSTTISNKIQIYILKIVTFIIKKQKKKQFEHLLKIMNILKYLKISLKALPHLCEILELIKNEEKFFEIQQTFLSFGILTIEQLNFRILKKVADKLKYG